MPVTGSERAAALKLISNCGPAAPRAPRWAAAMAMADAAQAATATRACRRIRMILAYPNADAVDASCGGDDGRDWISAGAAFGQASPDVRIRDRAIVPARSSGVHPGPRLSRRRVLRGNRSQRTIE